MSFPIFSNYCFLLTRGVMSGLYQLLHDIVSVQPSDNRR